MLSADDNSPRPGGGGYGYSDIRLGSFLGFKVFNFNISGGFQKNEYYLDIKILWIFLGITELYYI